MLSDHDLNLIPPPKDAMIIILFSYVFFFISGMTLLALVGKKYALLGEALLIVPAALIVWSKKLDFSRIFRLRAVPLPVWLYSGFLTLAVFVLGNEMDIIVNLIFPMPEAFANEIIEAVAIRSVRDGVIVILSGVFFAALFEEMLFRGMLQQSLEIHREPAMAMVLTAVLFAISHVNPWAALQILFLGLVLGYLTWKSDSIIPAMILHGGNNLLSIIFMNLPEDNLKWYIRQEHIHPTWLFLSVAVGLPALMLFQRTCNQIKSSKSLPF